MANRFQDLVQRLFARPEITEPGAPVGDQAAQFSPMASYYRSRMELSSTRIKKYKDYRDMGEDTLISGALDIYADESCQMSPVHHSTCWVNSRNPQVSVELMRMLDRIDIEDYIFGIARYLAQFGDNFVRPLASPDKGIVGIEFMEAEDVERLVDKYSRLTGFRVAPFGDRPFAPWDMVQFRIMSRTQTVRQGGSVYGTSMLENARRTWRQLTLLEDVLVIYRLEIAGRHRIFYIDVGGVSHDQALALTRRYQRYFGKKQYFNPENGEWTSRFNPLNLTADIFWPIRKDSNSRIDYLGVDPNVTGVVDIEYFRDKLFAALKIPKAYIGLDAYSSVKYGLAQIDVTFGRAVKRLQRAVINGLTRLCQIHLALVGLDPLRPENQFQLQMMSPSTLDEQQRMEAMDLSLNLAQKLQEMGQILGVEPEALQSYILRNILGLTPFDLRPLLEPEAEMVPDKSLADSFKDDSSIDDLFSDEALSALVEGMVKEKDIDLTSLKEEIGIAEASAASGDSDSMPFVGEMTEAELNELRSSLKSANPEN